MKRKLRQWHWKNILRWIFEIKKVGSPQRQVSWLVKYLSSGEYLLDNGWVGMQGIPTNNDFTHMPWFHFDSRKAAEADIGVTKRLADFILKHVDEDSNITVRQWIWKTGIDMWTGRSPWFSWL